MQILLLVIILLLSAIIFILISKTTKNAAGTIALNEDQKSLLRHDLKGQLGRISALTNLLTISSVNFSPEQKEYFDVLKLGFEGSLLIVTLIMALILSHPDSLFC